jgi:hypothetical protein
MIYVKSFLAGVVALILAAIITVCALFFGGPILGRLTHPDQGEVGFVVYGFHPWPVLTTATLIFAAAFYWTFKRNTRN